MEMNMDDLETSQDLNKREQTILDLLSDDLQEIPWEDPLEFLDMLGKPPQFLESMHCEVLKKIVENYRSFPKGENVSLLQLLLGQIDNDDCGIVKDQAKFLWLTQILINFDDTKDARTNCFRFIIEKTKYASLEGSLMWTEQLINVLILLLKKGCDITWSSAELRCDADEELLDSDSDDVPTENITSHSALYILFRTIVHVFNYEKHLIGNIWDLVNLCLIEGNLHHVEPRGNLLHALMNSDWEKIYLPLSTDTFDQWKHLVTKIVEANPGLLDDTNNKGRNPLQTILKRLKTRKDMLRLLDDVVPLLKSQSNINNQDFSGSTALHYLAKLFPMYSTKEISFSGEFKLDKHNIKECYHQGKIIFLKLMNLLKSSENIHMQDRDGKNVLHIFTEAVSVNPDLGADLLEFVHDIATAKNVCIQDMDSMTPHDYIAQGILATNYIHLEANEMCRAIESLFLDLGIYYPPLELIPGPCMQILKEISDMNCSLERLERLVTFMQSTEDWKASGNMDLSRNTLMNLNNISNPKVYTIMMEIMRLMAINKSTGDSIWKAMVSHLNRLHIRSPTSIFIEIIAICAENGAKMTDRELARILRWADPVTAKEENIASYLKLLVLMQKSKTFVFDMHFLADCYNISKDILHLGQELVQGMHGILENCLKSGKLIDCFLYISSGQTKLVLLDEMLENSVPKHWLNRSALHLAVIFSDDDSVLQCFSQQAIAKYLNTKYVHECTALHVAYLHQNQSAVQFLISNGAKVDVFDNFGVTPCEEIADSGLSNDHKAVRNIAIYDENEHDHICCSIIESNSGIIDKLRHMIVLPQHETQALCDELEMLFLRLVKETKFCEAAVFIAGSLRERLKIGCLDEADVQIRFKCSKYDEEHLKEELQESLIDSMAKISWEGVYLRPVNVKVPWKFIHEGKSIYHGLTMSVDLVPVIVHDKDLSTPIEPSTENELNYEVPHILADAPKQRKMTYIVVNTWLGKPRHFHQSQFAFEWDVLDSLPKSYRLSIVMAKSLIHAYDVSKGDKHVSMPISSYSLKTAIFFLIIEDLSKYKAAVLRTASEAFKKSVKRMVRHLETALMIAKNYCAYGTSHTLVFNANPTWTTDKDLKEYGEEARIIASRIFIFIGTLAKLGWKLVRYWDVDNPISERLGFGEAEYICSICECLLERLDKSTFY